MKKFARTLLGCSLMIATLLPAGAIPTSLPTTTTLIGVQVELNDYAGKYKMEGLPFEYIEVSIKEGKLHIVAGGNEGDLTPGQEADTFEGNNGSVFKFGRNDQKKVATLTLEAQGLTFMGAKE